MPEAVPMPEALTRIVDGRELPLTGNYVMDVHNSSVSFVARHMMLTKVRGQFEHFSGRFTVAERIEDSTVSVEMDAASITTSSDKRDSHLRSEDFLDVENHPEVSFSSTSIEPDGDRWKMKGDLTIRDVTREISLDVEFLGAGRDPYGKSKAMFTAVGDLHRADWNITWNQVLEGGGVLVGPTAKLEIEAQGVHQVE